MGMWLQMLFYLLALLVCTHFTWKWFLRIKGLNFTFFSGWQSFFRPLKDFHSIVNMDSRDLLPPYSLAWIMFTPVAVVSDYKIIRAITDNQTSAKFIRPMNFKISKHLGMKGIIIAPDHRNMVLRQVVGRFLKPCEEAEQKSVDILADIRKNVANTHKKLHEWTTAYVIDASLASMFEKDFEIRNKWNIVESTLFVINNLYLWQWTDFLPFWGKVPTKFNLRMQRSWTEVKRLCTQLEATECPLVASLCDARNEDIITAKEKSHTIRSLYFACETTAKAAARLVLELAKKPAVYQQLKQSSDSVIYQTIRELLEPYPTLPLIGRRATQDVLVGDITITKDTLVLFSVKDANRKGNSPIDMHFGVGIRACSGMTLANLHLLVKELGKHYSRLLLEEAFEEKSSYTVTERVDNIITRVMGDNLFLSRL